MKNIQSSNAALIIGELSCTEHKISKKYKNDTPYQSISLPREEHHVIYFQLGLRSYKGLRLQADDLFPKPVGDGIPPGFLHMITR